MRVTVDNLGNWPCANCVSADAAKDRRNWTTQFLVDTTHDGLTLIRCGSCGYQREAQIEFLPERLTGEDALRILPRMTPEDPDVTANALKKLGSASKLTLGTATSGTTERTTAALTGSECAALLALVEQLQTRVKQADRTLDALSGDVLMHGTSYGAWWAVGEAAASATMWESDPGLSALMTILARLAYTISELRTEDRKDARAALVPAEDA